ncbi:reverse transcriptase domain-containing protein [Tanacetum coccineum]
MSIEINKKKELQYLEQVARISTYTTEPSRHFNCTCYDDDDYEESTIPLNEIDFSNTYVRTNHTVYRLWSPRTLSSWGMRNLALFLKRNTDEFIKSSVEELVPIPITPLFDSNKDECFTPSDDVELLLHHDSSTPMISVVSILEGFTNEPPLEENDDLFDLKSKKNKWKKILYDDPIDDLISTPGDKRVITAGNDGCILYGHGYCYEQIQEAEGITMNKVAMIDFRNKQVVTCFHGHVTAAGGIVFEMEDYSWLYGVYEETVDESLPLERIEKMEDKIKGLEIRHDDEIVLARVRISTLEMIIEDIKNLRLPNESIFAELDNSLWIIAQPLGSEPVLEKLNELDAC